MTTHDIDIELPPLPSPPSLAQRKDWNGAIQAYAWNYGKECALAAIEADRKRGGEPVAWRWQWKDLPDSGWQLSSVGGWRETDAIRAEPLYLAPIAPQPALDAADLAFIADELRQAGKNRAADLVMQAMAYPTQPAEPVKVPVDTPEALRFAARVVELYDDATMVNDYMIDSGECAGILNALADYFARYGQPTEWQDFPK